MVTADVIECPDGLALDEDSADAAARPQVYRALLQLCCSSVAALLQTLLLARRCIVR